MRRHRASRHGSNHHDPTEGTESVASLRSRRNGACSSNHHDPTEGTERSIARAACEPCRTVPTITTRPRVLKESSRRPSAADSANVPTITTRPRVLKDAQRYVVDAYSGAGSNHHDPTEGTERAARSSCACVATDAFQPSRPDRGY